MSVTRCGRVQENNKIEKSLGFVNMEQPEAGTPTDDFLVEQ